MFPRVKEDIVAQEIDRKFDSGHLNSESDTFLSYVINFCLFHTFSAIILRSFALIAKSLSRGRLGRLAGHFVGSSYLLPYYLESSYLKTSYLRTFHLETCDRSHPCASKASFGDDSDNPTSTIVFRFIRSLPTSPIHASARLENFHNKYL
jgi:hypothetical protein